MAGNQEQKSISREQIAKKIKTESQDFFNITYNKILIFLPEHEKKEEDLALADIHSGNFSSAIRHLRVALDAYCRINSKFTEIEGHLVYQRDATHQESLPETYHKWAILGLNYFRAAFNIIKMESHLPCDSDLDNLAKEFFENIKKVIITTGKQVNPEVYLAQTLHEKLIPLIQRKTNLTVNEIIEQLESIKDFGQFDGTGEYIIATRIKNPENLSTDLLHVEVPMTGQLTAKQTEEYQAINVLTFNELIRYQNKIRLGLKKLDEKEKNLPQWFKNQPFYIQKMIHQVAEKILKGKAIPLSLNDKLAGVRSGYEEFVYQDESLIYQGYHAGIPGHLFRNKALNIKSTQEALTQLESMINPIIKLDKTNDANLWKDFFQEFQKSENHSFQEETSFKDKEQEASPAKKNAIEPSQWLGKKIIVMQSLLSPINFLKHDGNLNRQIMNAVSNLNNKEDVSESNQYLFRNNTPVDYFRKFEYLKLYDNDKNSFAGIYKIYRLADFLCQYQFIQLDVELKNKLAKVVSLFEEYYLEVYKGADPDNKNLTLIAAANVMASLINQLIGTEVVALILFDESGKNTGTQARLASICKAIELDSLGSITMQQLIPFSLYLDSPDTINFSPLLRSGLIQRGFPDTKTEASQHFFNKTIYYNRSFPTVPKYTPWYKNPKYLLGLSLAAVSIALCATGFGAIFGGPALITLIASATSLEASTIFAIAIGLVGLGSFGWTGGAILMDQSKKVNSHYHEVEKNNKILGRKKSEDFPSPFPGSSPKIFTQLRNNKPNEKSNSAEAKHEITEDEVTKRETTHDEKDVQYLDGPPKVSNKASDSSNIAYNIQKGEFLHRYVNSLDTKSEDARSAWLTPER